LGKVFNSTDPLTITKTAYGIGQKDHPDVPNILRVSLAETVENTSSGHEALIIQCNIDDMNPEFFDHISERLFNSGASDVYLSNIIMKKGRPAIILNVILEKEYSDAVKQILFTETTTIGLRIFPFTKETLVRRFETFDSRWGTVTVKRSFFQGKQVSVKPEYEDCKRIAVENNIPVKEVYNDLLTEINKSGKN
jgi:uncharacterized protein (DUF111 family)